jgi:hypothetical protein
MVTPSDMKRIIRTMLENLVGVEAQGQIRYEAIFDDEHARYQIMAIGWKDNKQVLRPVALLEIKNDIIWIHADNTDYDIAGELLRVGLNPHQIVLGFQPPMHRQHSGFAVGE